MEEEEEGSLDLLPSRVHGSDLRWTNGSLRCIESSMVETRLCITCLALAAKDSQVDGGETWTDPWGTNGLKSVEGSFKCSSSTG